MTDLIQAATTTTRAFCRSLWHYVVSPEDHQATFRRNDVSPNVVSSQRYAKMGVWLGKARLGFTLHLPFGEISVW